MDTSAFSVHQATTLKHKGYDNTEWTPAKATATKQQNNTTVSSLPSKSTTSRLGGMSDIQSEVSGYGGYSAAIKRPQDNRH